MRKTLFFMFLLPLMAEAQEDGYDHALKDFYKDSTGKMILLPFLNSWELTLIPDSVDRTNPYKIKSEDQYYQVFSKFETIKLPVIDFSVNYLLGRSVCIYCLTVCEYFKTNLQPCHRQACQYA